VETQKNKELAQHLLHPNHDDGPIELLVTYTALDAEVLLKGKQDFASHKVAAKFFCAREDFAFDVFDTLDNPLNRIDTVETAHQ
jgi:hypothetical protein